MQETEKSSSNFFVIVVLIFCGSLSTGLSPERLRDYCGFAEDSGTIYGTVGNADPFPEFNFGIQICVSISGPHD